MGGEGLRGKGIRVGVDGLMYGPALRAYRVGGEGLRGKWGCVLGSIAGGMGRPWGNGGNLGFMSGEGAPLGAGRD